MNKIIILLLLFISICLSPYAMADIEKPELKLSSWKDGQAIISWNLIKEASYYNIYGGDTPASATVNPINKIASTSIQFYIDNSLHSYCYYIVTTVSNDNIESKPSNIASLAGKLWITRDSFDMQFNNIIFANNNFVAINGYNILTSPDGITWTQHVSNMNILLYDITFADNKFVVVGPGGVILTSFDALTWTVQTSGVSKDLNHVFFADNKFMVAGDSGIILTSTDGITWTQQASGVNNNLYDITFANNKFVILGSSGVILTSADAVVWTKQVISDIYYLKKIIFANNKFVIIGVNNNKERIILTSSDCVTWTKRIIAINYDLYDITFANAIFAAVGGGGTILTSPDGISWTKQVNENDSYYLQKIIFANDEFVTIGMNSNSGIILTSSNGRIWTQQLNKTYAYLCDIIFANNRFVAVGGRNFFLTSP